MAEDTNLDTLAARVRRDICEGPGPSPADVRALSDGVLELARGLGLDVSGPTEAQLEGLRASCARAASPEHRAEIARAYPGIEAWLPATGVE